MKHRIVILGAGYTGTAAATRLARRLHPGDVDITLVNAEPDFVERIRMHQVAAGQDLPRRPLAQMFAGTGVTLRVAQVRSVDADRRVISLSDDDGAGELAYDTLVHALGSTWNDGGVPGVAEHAYDVAGRPGAVRLRNRLRELGPGGRVVVVGGGLTGIEASTEIAEARPDLDVAVVVRGGFAGPFSQRGRRHLRAVFGRLGITVHEHGKVEKVGAAEVVTNDGAIPADVTVWTAGFAARPIAAETTTVSAGGAIVVDATMRSVSHRDVYAVGDAALAAGPNGTHLRMSCASGIPTAWQAADAIAARLTGGKLPNIPLRYVQQCISLGRRDGLIQVVTADDRARSAAFGGRMAARFKESICRGAAAGVTNPLLPYPVRRRRVIEAPVPVGVG